MIKSCVLGVLLCVGTGLAVTQQQLAQYVAAQQTGLRPQSGSRQAYALQGAEEGDETAYQQAYQPYQQPGAYQAQPAGPAASSYKSFASSGATPAGPLYYRPAPQAQAGPGPQYKLRPLAEKGEPEDYDHNPAYQFSFDVKDDEFTNYQNRKEQREGDKISGSYSVVDSDGYIRTVTYTADPKEGFKADVTREPTDIRIKIPQPPSALPQQYHQVPQQFVRKQQTQQYLEASSPALAQYSAAAPQYSGKPQGVAYVAPQFAAGPVPQYKAPSSGGLGAYGSHRLAAPVKGKAAAIGYSAQSPTAGPILYQAYQQ